MSKRLDANQMTAALKTPGPKRAAGSRVDKLTAPVHEMGVEVTLDQVRAYDRNPRTQRNPKYEEIKASIREVGLKQPPSVTQRPGDDKYMISDGGNTRLEILNELWEETKDEGFYRFWCVYRPWVSEVHALAGHLSENESRSDLSWIEKSLGVKALKDELEAAEGGESISQRELVRKAAEEGFTLDQSHISRMLYTVEHFYPSLPLSLESGMGQSQIKKLIAYREACLLIWKRIDSEGDAEGLFDVAWHETISQFDHEEQTVLPWDIVEDRLLGMLEDHSGAHLHVLDHTLKTILEYRRRRWSLDNNEQDVWGQLDLEMRAIRNPDAVQPQPQPGDEEPPQTTPPTPPVGIGTTEGAIQPQSQNQPAGDAQLPADKSQEDQGGEPTNQSLDSSVGQEPSQQGAGMPAPEQPSEAGLQQKGEQDHGNMAGSNDTALEGDGATITPPKEEQQRNQPSSPIPDIWHIEPQYRKPRQLRVQIGQVAQAIAQAGGFNVPDDEHHPVQVDHDNGLGYSLEPLSPEQEENRLAQMIWQFLAGLIGEAHPGYPSDTTLLGELLGTSDAQDCLPDEILVQVFRLVRLMRVLRDQLASEEGGEA